MHRFRSGTPREDAGNLSPVKMLRLWLMLCLAVLLPLRGAVAAAMLCPMTGPAAQSALHEERGAGFALHHAGALDGMADHGLAAHASHDEAHHGHADATDKCSTCSAFCCVTPLASHAPRLAAPARLAVHTFPPLTVPAPTFLSDGQERPPRSI